MTMTIPIKRKHSIRVCLQFLKFSPLFPCGDVYGGTQSDMVAESFSSNGRGKGGRHWGQDLNI